jgi:hypothetical protein
MQRISYAGEHFLTGNEITSALVSYAAALAHHGSAESIEIPVVNEEDGRPGTAIFLIGPASQIVAEEFDAGGYDEIHDDELVARLRTLTAQLAPMHPITPTAPTDQEDSVGYDWTDEV